MSSGREHRCIGRTMVSHLLALLASSALVHVRVSPTHTATSPPPPHVDHRRAADVQADVQAVVALAAPASRWFGRSRSPASWGCLASSALLEWALCSKYCQITHTCAQINILRVPHTLLPRANVRVVNRANRAPPGGGASAGLSWTRGHGGVAHATRHTQHAVRPLPRRRGRTRCDVCILFARKMTSLRANLLQI